MLYLGISFKNYSRQPWLANHGTMNLTLRCSKKLDHATMDEMGFSVWIALLASAAVSKKHVITRSWLCGPVGEFSA